MAIHPHSASASTLLPGRPLLRGPLPPVARPPWAAGLQRWHRTLAALAWAAVAAGAAWASAAPAQPQPQVQPQVLAQGLEHPWALAFIAPDRVLVTERAGRLRLVTLDGRVSPPLQGLPAIDEGGQGGLLDLITDRDFERNRTLYFCFSEPARAGGGNSTALARARLADDARRLEQVRVIFRQSPKVGSQLHFGCRIVQGTDGHLFLTLGERFSRMDDAQTLDNHHGKVVRVATDGSVPGDNPLLGRAGALPEIWSWGHRNPQGAALGPDGQLWIHEHGPRGGDEVNRVLPGRNYGWPVITFGVNYIGTRIGAGITAHPGMEQPLHHWTPSIAPSGMAFLTSARYGPHWQGSLFVGALRERHLARLRFDGDRLVEQERLLEALGQRIRDVRQGPDGLLYVLTDERNGQLLRLLPTP